MQLLAKGTRNPRYASENNILRSHYYCLPCIVTLHCGCFQKKIMTGISLGEPLPHTQSRPLASGMSVRRQLETFAFIST